MRRRVGLLVAFVSCGTAAGQVQNSYTGQTITGQLQLIGTTNLSTLAVTSFARTQSVGTGAAGPEQPKFKALLPPPPPIQRAVVASAATSGMARTQSLETSTVTSPTGFSGLTHRDQRMANSGNQFSLEPPNPSIAVANGMILEGVNDAVQVFSVSGTPLVPPIASNQLFGLAPAINRSFEHPVYGVYTTDMRVFFDQDTSRWMVLQRSQDEDSAGNPVNQSHIYLAVSRTSDPTGDYNIYSMDTTNNGVYGCPCVSDYPQIGADRYGFYISTNEYSIQDPTFPSYNYHATILAISKADLAAGVSGPVTSMFEVPYFTGYEFTIHPATTPPGASPFLANGGAEYFVSSYPVGYDGALSMWAMTNTASLQSSSPNLLLTQATISTLPHVPPPGCAPQRAGPLTLGTTLECLDAGYYSDSRVLSVSYSGGRLFVTLATAVFDSLGNNAAGGLYVIFSPTIRNGILSATPPVKQGYISATSNHILRPAISVNAQGKGAIAFTLVGRDYYPSSAFVSIDLTAAPPSVIQIAAAGALPEDGFSGYDGSGVARWGDYSTAVTAPDGSIWLVNEYIPNAPRSPSANWGTYISKYQP